MQFGIIGENLQVYPLIFCRLLYTNTGVKYSVPTSTDTIAIIAKNSVKRISMLGSFMSPSIRKPIRVSTKDTAAMFTIFLFMVMGLVSNNNGLAAYLVCIGFFYRSFADAIKPDSV